MSRHSDENVDAGSGEFSIDHIMLSCIFICGILKLNRILQTVSLLLGTNLSAHQEASFTTGFIEIETLQRILTIIFLFFKF